MGCDSYARNSIQRQDNQVLIKKCIGIASGCDDSLGQIVF